MNIIVISGINLFEAGALSIYKDCLTSIVKLGLDKKYKIVAFVHKKTLFKEFDDLIQFIELPKSRKNYFYRLWYEYVYFNTYSKNKDIHTWLSLHDITPNVKSKYLYTYCHNPTPFLKAEIKNIKYGLTNYLFSLFYVYLYKINIKKNDAIIVQQQWLRKAFKEMYGISNIIVSRPNITINKKEINVNNTFNKYMFIFPSYPRFFKNFEVVCKACEKLESDFLGDFEIYLTLNGTENNYSKMIYKKYAHLSSIHWIGIQTRDDLFNLYTKADTLIFPSKLETWGLPISEFKVTKKSILLADLPYAHETIGVYDKVSFFSPNDADFLANLMKKEILNINNYEKREVLDLDEPFAKDWNKLFEIIGLDSQKMELSWCM